MILQRYYVSIDESLRRILGTPLGSRVMRPEFGTRLYELVDKRFDDEWKIDAVRFVFEAIDKWEKRIDVIKINPSILENKISIEIVYKEKESGQMGNFTYA